MIDIARILCPVDFSECSGRALEHAAALARWYKARVTVFHAFDAYVPQVTGPESLGSAPMPLLPPVLPEEVAESVRHFSEPFINATTASEIVVREGRPVNEIVNESERMSADLLVMGTHGRGGFDRLLLGSVAEKVLRKARCPVLTVPPPSRRLTEGPVIFKTILCPLDFSPSSIRAVEYALSLAKEADARLVLLHVIETSIEDAHLGEMAHFTVPEYFQHMKHDAAERLKTIVPDEARVWCKPEERLASGKAHREVLRVAAETGAELIVMGVHGRGAVDVALFGSTTNHVVRHAACPVLTLRS